MADDGKDTEFYGATVNAWYTTRMERDRSLLTLSAGGIGLLVTLLSTVGIHSSEALVLYIVALVAFTTCLGAVLWIFQRNADHLEDVVKDRAHSDSLLRTLDSVAVWSFLLAVVLSSIVGVGAAIHSREVGETDMAEHKGKGTGRVIGLDESYDGAANMRPVEIIKSFDGAANMKPAPAPTPATPPTVVPEPPAPAPAPAAPTTNTEK